MDPNKPHDHKDPREPREPKARSATLADRRAAQGATADDLLRDADADFGLEHSPSSADPPNAPADTRGGEAEGYTPQTRV